MSLDNPKVRTSRCLCCRSYLPLGFENANYDEETVSTFSIKLNEFNASEDILHNQDYDPLPFNFEWFCNLLEVRVPPNATFGTTGISFCKSCSEILTSLKNLEDLLERTRLEIQEKLKLVKFKATFALTDFEEGETDQFFSFIGTQLRKSTIEQKKQSVNIDENGTDTEIRSPVDSIDGEIEIKEESPQYFLDEINDQLEFCELDNPFSNLLSNEEVEIKYETDLVDSMMTDLLPEESDVQEKNDSSRKPKRKRGNYDSDIISDQPKVQEANVGKRSTRQKRKSTRFVDFVDPDGNDKTEIGSKSNRIKLSKSDKKLVARFGLDRSPEPRIQLEDVCKNNSNAQSFSAKIEPIYISNNSSEDELESAAPGPKRFKKSKRATKYTRSKSTSKPRRKTANHGISEKSSSAIMIMNDAEIEAEQLPNVKSQDPDFQLTSEDDGISDSEQDSEDVSDWEDSKGAKSRTVRKTKITIRRGSRVKIKRNSRKPRQTANFTIVTENGKNFYKKQEIHLKNDYWLCPFETCNFKLRKTEEDIKSCEEMKNHLSNRHANDLKYHCPHCDIYFQWKRELWDHNAIHPKPKVRECQICQKPLSVNSSRAHAWTHLNQDERAAWIASGKSDPTINYIKKKEELKKNPSFQCAHCGEVFAYLASLQAHERIHVDKKVRPKFPCDEPDCPQVYISKRGLYYHKIRAHNPDTYLGKWKYCKICEPPKKFYVQTLLDVHNRRFHNAERVHKCPDCDKAFPDLSCLKRHLVVHMADDYRPFKCEFCPVAYRYKKNVKRHIRSAHKDKNFTFSDKKIAYYPPPPSLPVMTCQRMYPCEICGDKFFQMHSRLKKHLTKAHGQQYVYDSAKPVRKNSNSNSANVRKHDEASGSATEDPKYDKLNSAVDSIMNEESSSTTAVL